MITFADVPDLAPTFERLVATDVRAAQRRAHDKFSARFAPAAIFHRAAIYRDWGLTQSPYVPHDAPLELGSAVVNVAYGKLAGPLTLRRPCLEDPLRWTNRASGRGQR